MVDHYNTEKFGVQALGKFIKKKFPDLEIKFIDIPNPGLAAWAHTCRSVAPQDVRKILCQFLGIW